MENSAGYGAQKMNEELAFAMRTLIVNNHLTPDEIIAFEHQMVLAAINVSAECCLREAIEMRKNERAVDVAAAKIVEVANQKLKTTKHPAKRQTPAQWCKHFGVEVLDPDGWNRHDPNCMSYPISQSMFIECYQKSTCRIVDSDKFRKYQHLFC